MAHFTQLGISGNPDKKPETKPGKTSPNQSPQPQRPNSNPKKLTDKQKTAALVGSAIMTLLLAVFLLESGCSKGIRQNGDDRHAKQTWRARRPLLPRPPRFNVHAISPADRQEEVASAKTVSVDVHQS